MRSEWQCVQLTRVALFCFLLFREAFRSSAKFILCDCAASLRKWIPIEDTISKVDKYSHYHILMNSVRLNTRAWSIGKAFQLKPWTKRSILSLILLGCFSLSCFLSSEIIIVIINDWLWIEYEPQQRQTNKNLEKGQLCDSNLKIPDTKTHWNQMCNVKMQ